MSSFEVMFKVKMSKNSGAWVSTTHCAGLPTNRKESEKIMLNDLECARTLNVEAGRLGGETLMRNNVDVYLDLKYKGITLST